MRYIVSCLCVLTSKMLESKIETLNSNLNGKYLNGSVSESARFQGIYWNDFRGPTYSLRAVKMLIKSIEYD